jgi:hypothetical protein
MITESGTIDELVADAAAAHHQVTARLVRDWSQIGLLDYPVKRSAGRGQGSRPALYPATQRMLFLTELHHRRAGQGIASLARIPVGIWMYWGEEYVPLSQARRAYLTWLGGRAISKASARATARAIVEQVGHPAADRRVRAHLVNVLAQIAYNGRLDDERLEPAFRAVFEPGHQQIRRAVGHPEAPMTTDAFIKRARARILAVRRFISGQVTDEEFLQARSDHLLHYADYCRRQSVYAAARGQTDSDIYKPVSLETALNDCCSHLLTTIGLAATQRQHP